MGSEGTLDSYQGRLAETEEWDSPRSNLPARPGHPTPPSSAGGSRLSSADVAKRQQQQHQPPANSSPPSQQHGGGDDGHAKPPLPQYAAAPQDAETPVSPAYNDDFTEYSEGGSPAVPVPLSPASPAAAAEAEADAGDAPASPASSARSGSERSQSSRASSAAGAAAKGGTAAGYGGSHRSSSLSSHSASSRHSSRSRSSSREPRVSGDGVRDDASASARSSRASSASRGSTGRSATTGATPTPADADLDDPEGGRERTASDGHASPAPAPASAAEDSPTKSARSSLPPALRYSPYAYIDKPPVSWDERIAHAQRRTAPAGEAERAQSRLTRAPHSMLTVEQNRKLRQVVLERNPLMRSRPIRKFPKCHELLAKEKEAQRRYMEAVERQRAAPIDPLLNPPCPQLRGAAAKKKRTAGGPPTEPMKADRRDSDARVARSIKGIGVGTLAPPPKKGALKLSIPTQKSPVPVTNNLGELVDTIDADKLYHESRDPPVRNAAPFSSAERKIVFPGATQCSPGPVYNVKSDWSSGTARQRAPHRVMQTFIISPGPGEYSVERADGVTRPNRAHLGTIPGDRRHADSSTRVFAGVTLPVSAHLGSYEPDRIRPAPKTQHVKMVRKLDAIQTVTDGNMRQGISAGDAFRRNPAATMSKVDREDAKLLAKWERVCIEDEPYLPPNTSLQRSR